jgi:hypothetical protein
MAFDMSKLTSQDKMIVGGGVVALVASFMPWYGYTGPLHLYGASISGWSAGFTAWFGCLLMAAAAAFVLAQRMGREVPELPVGPAVAVAGGAVIGLGLVVIRWLTLPRLHTGLVGSIGPKFGIWLAILAGIVEVAGAVMEFRGSGEALPWATGEAGSAPQG